MELICFQSDSIRIFPPEKQEGISSEVDAASSSVGYCIGLCCLTRLIVDLLINFMKRAGMGIDR